MNLLILGVGIGVVVVLLLASRQCLLPKPIAGIPFDKEAANRILGDIPSVCGVKASRAFLTTWDTHKCDRQSNGKTRQLKYGASFASDRKSSNLRSSSSS
jgi:hypothetical protein